MTEVGVWLDCDPGHDDAMAIILAAYGRQQEGGAAVKLLGISTVHGNQTVEKTTRNALAVHHAGGLPSHVRIARGAAHALIRRGTGCPEIHGSTGLDTKGDERVADDDALQAYSDANGGILVNHRVSGEGEAEAVTAIACMASVILASALPVVLVCTGALTNAALLLSVYPQVAERLQRIVLMGGALGMGNTSPCAEWNIQVDPEAAKIVFASSVAIVQVPLEVTHTVCVTDAIVERIRGLEDKQGVNKRFLRLVLDWMLFFAATYKEVFDFPDPPLHDPLTLAFLLAPNLFSTRKMNVEIDTASAFSLGRTVCDYYSTTGRPANATMCLKVDIDGFWELMLGALEEAALRSNLSEV